MNFIYEIIYSGHLTVNTSSEKRGVMLSNAIGLSLLSLSLFLFVLYYVWFGWSVVTAAIPCIGLLAFGAVALNRYGYTFASRAWVCLFLPIIITVLSIYSKRIYYATQEELDYFTFRFIILGSCAFPWILFSIREKRYLLFCSITGLLILLLYDPLHYVFDVGYSKDAMKIKTYYFTNIVIFISYCLLVSALAFLKWLSEKNEARNLELIDELNQANKLLMEKNVEIEAQSAELLAQSDTLAANQKQLMDAYLVISEQKNKLLSQNESLSTELILKNKDLVETNTELIKHNNELRQFSYTVSHNLRGPVASLLGLTHLMEEHPLSDPEAAEIFEHIKTSTVRLDTIIKDLTKIIDIRHDIFKIRQKINVEQILNEILQVLRKDIELHGVVVIRKIESCPVVYSVKPMVHSILYNLISNAIKYRSPERTPVLEIIVQERDEYYTLDLRDNGLGIDIAQNKDNLFKLYKRFHFHTEGKGLGLYLVKLQAEALGGTVAVESEINRYSNFKVYLRKPENIQRQILYKESYAEIFFDARINSTGVVWYGPVTSKQYRSAFQKCLDFVKIYNTPSYIADLSMQGHVEKEDQLWMFSEILPEAARNGLRRIAAIRPDAADAHVRDYLQGINEALGKLGIWQEFFLSMQEAVDWIQEENEKVSLKIKSDGRNS